MKNLVTRSSLTQLSIFSLTDNPKRRFTVFILPLQLAFLSGDDDDDLFSNLTEKFEILSNGNTSYCFVFHDIDMLPVSNFHRHNREY